MSSGTSIARKLHSTTLISVLVMGVTSIGLFLGFGEVTRKHDALNRLHRQRSSAANLERLTLETLHLLDAAIYHGNSSGIPELLARSEDLQSALSALEDTAFAYGDSEVQSFTAEAEPLIVALRNDIVRCVAYLREGRGREAHAYYSTSIRQHVSPIQGFVERFSRSENHQIEDSTKRLHALQKVVLWASIAMFVTMLTLIAVVNTRIARSITRPLTGLIQSTRRLAAGDWTARLSLLSNDELGELAASFNDMVARRRQADEDLRESQENLATTLNCIGDAVISTNTEGRIIRMNPVAESLTAWKASEAEGLPIEDVLHIINEDTRQPIESPACQALQKGKTVGLAAHSVLIARDGGEYPIDDSAAPIRDANGQLAGAVIVFRDVTEARRTERILRDYAEELEAHQGQLKAQQRELLSLNRELEAAQQSAEAASRAKSEFLANMSHEIRTPMTAILGFADVLLESINLNGASAEQIDAAKTIKRNGEHLLGIINDILDLSKVEAGKMSLEHITCNPCHIVAEVVSLMKIKADNAGLSFKLKYLGAVPQTIRTDPTRLKQILINLCGNAIKFTETGGVTLITRYVDDRDKPRMQFDVIDTGVGMTEEQLGRLFKPFTQADASTTRRFGGTGLGLSISRRLAEMLGGDLTATRSSDGAGMHFSLTVAAAPPDGTRLIQDPMSATVISSRTDWAGTNESTLRGRRILIAEDGPDNQRLLAHLLEKAGADVSISANGSRAVEMALTARDQGEPFDVILMDMQMPVMDGYEATALLRQRGYTGPIIALTAHAMTGERDKCVEAGCDDYASKPINWQQLTDTIQSQLQHARASQADPRPIPVRSDDHARE